MMSNLAKWLMWGAAALFYTYQYVLRVMPNNLLSEITTHFNVDASALGQFSGVYYVGYALIHIPLAIFLDRYGPRKVLALCSVLTSVGLAPLIYGNSWWLAVLGRCLVGAASAGGVLGLFSVVRIGFGDAKFSRMVGFGVTLGLIGAIFGGGPVKELCMQFGYHRIVSGTMTLGLIIAAITYFSCPDSTTNGFAAHASVLAEIKQILSNKALLIVCLASGFMVAPIEGFADVWGSRFLISTYGLEASRASFLLSSIFVGMCLGSTLIGIMAEHLGRIRTIVVCGVFMLAIFLLLTLGWIETDIALTASLFLVGVFCGYQIPALDYASSCVRSSSSGLAASIANMIIMIFGYLSHSSIGWTIARLGGLDSPNAVLYGVLVVPASLAAGLATLLLLKKVSKTNPRNRLESE